jgi:tetratricopeptide (TPR) repeat protein
VCSLLKTEFQAHQDAGNHQAALEAAELAIQRDANDKESWTYKVQCLEALGHDLEKRLACWRRVTEIDPSDGIAWNKQDLILSQLERFEEALLPRPKHWS